MKRFTLKNLDCANCAMKLEIKLNGLPSVRSAKVMFASSSLLIDSDDIDEVKRAVKDHEENLELIEGAQKEEGGEDNTKKELLKLGAYILLFAIAAAWITFFPQKPFVFGGYALLVVIYFSAGWNVISSAFSNILKGRVFDENFLMTFATLAAFAIGAYTESVAVMLFYKAGEFFQELAVNRSRRSIKALVAIRPDRAVVIRDGVAVAISPENAIIDDIAIVKPGEKVPLDGVVVKGASSVDKRALTGESVPVGVKEGDNVFAGSINISGLLEMRVTKLFAESSVSKILDLVENAASNKAKTENFITTFARYYTPAVFAISALIAVVPPLAGYGTFSEWIYRALVVLVVSCPCALVISVPLGYFGGIGAASKRGILIKGANYLEALANVKAAAFDKTGTLTRGVFKVTEISPRNGFSKDDVLRYAAFAESKSNHPIARSIMDAYGKSFDGDVSEYEEISGHGVKIVIGGRTLMAGNDRMLHKFEIEHGESECSVEGGVAHIVVDGIYAGYLIISDELKSETKDALVALKSLGVEKTAVLTGDNKFAAKRILGGLAIDECYTDLLPEDKAEAFKSFKSEVTQGKTIFAGDGINDAPVLAAADVGIAMGAMGSDAAIETADVVIMDDSPMKIAEAVKLARKTKAIIWQNILFALSVKAVFVVLGFFGIATMWEAVFGDIGVALIALFNSMRLVWDIKA